MCSLVRLLLAPLCCTGCRRPGTQWCLDCAAVVARPRVLHLDIPVIAHFGFEGPIRRCIIDWKDEGQSDARARVVSWFRAGLLPLIVDDVVVVPVPASRASMRRRGAPVLLDAVRDAVPEASIAQWLVATQRRHDQVGLNRAARQRNVHGTMRWVGPRDRPIILVDDILTTGATLRESIRAMRTAGVEPTTAFVIAHRERAASVARAAAGLRLPQNDDMGGFRGFQ